MTTDEYRDEFLVDAKKRVQAARILSESATTKKAKREAADTLAFWSNEVRALRNLRTLLKIQSKTR